MKLFGWNIERERRSLENPTVSLSDAKAWYSFFGIAESDAGVVVTRDVALSVPSIWAAVHFIAGTIASLPLQLFRKTDGAREIADKDPLYSILHDWPNDEWSSFRWRKYSMVNTLLTGRSYTFIERNKAGRVMNLWPLDPAKITVEHNSEGRTIYRFNGPARGSNNPVFKANEIIDIPFMLQEDGYRHIAPIEKLKNAIGLSIALERFASRFFQSGGVPPLALHGPINSAEAAKRAGKDILEGIRRARGEDRNVLVMPIGHELKAIGVDNDKSQMVEARRFQLEESARIYNLSPVFLQDLSKGTYSNTEQQDLHVVKHTLTQWLKAWEQEMNLKLFPARNRTNFVEFNIDGLLRGDFKTRMEGYSKAISTAINTPNEVRRMENWPDHPEGDALLIQGATVPLGSQQIEPLPNKPSDTEAPNEEGS